MKETPGSDSKDKKNIIWPNRRGDGGDGGKARRWPENNILIILHTDIHGWIDHCHFSLY